MDISGRVATVLMLAAGVVVDVASAAEPTLRSFDRMLPLEEAAATTAGVSIGDVNGDGRLDLVLARGRHWPLVDRLFLGDGQGGLSPRDLGETPDRTYSAALADLDGDADLDLVVSNDRPDRKLLYRNDGRGNFQEAGTFGEPAWPTRYVTLADLNGDGRLDIIAANRNGSASRSGPNPRSPTLSSVCFNQGEGKFAPGRPLPVESATLIVAADFDGDGAIDLFVPHRDGGQSVLLWNDGQGAFPQVMNLGSEQSQTRAAAGGDLNGDGRVDLVFGGEEGKGALVFLNAGKRSFMPPSPLSSGEAIPTAIAIADLNKDDRADVIVGHEGTPGSAYLGDGSGTAFREVHWNDGAGNVYGVGIGDLNGDSWPDIAAARSGAPSAIWFSTPIIQKK